MLGRYLDLANPVADHPLNQGLVAWWLPLPNNSGGNTLFDLKGKFPLSFNNGPLWRASTLGFPGIRFDGSDDYLSAGTAVLSGLPLTVTAWIQPRANGINSIFSLNAGTSNYFYLYLFNGGIVVESVGGGSANASGESANFDQWNFVAAVWASTTSRTVYLNNRVPVNNTSTSSPTGVTTTEIGRFTSSNPNIFNGDIADVRVYNRVLSDSDVYGVRDQGIRGHPETLRRWSRTPWSFGTTAGGTGYTASLAGSSTATGSLTRAVSKALAGSCTGAGAVVKAAAKALAGTTTGTGSLAKLTAKALAGSTTATGSLGTITVKALAASGSVTGAGVVTKAATKALAGSTTASGATAKAVAKPLAGTTTPAGATAKAVAKPLAGSTTPAGSLGTLGSKTLAAAGSVTATGVVTKAAAKALAGSTTGTGSLARAVAKPLAGTITVSGAVAKATAKPLAGSTTPAGTVSALRLAILSVAGAVTAAGALVKAVAKALVGFLTGTGGLTTVGGVSTRGGAVSGTIAVARRVTGTASVVPRVTGTADALPRVSGTVDVEVC